jgi:hypothetical protein
MPIPLDEWIRRRTPGVPEAFASHMRPREPGAAAGAQTLAAEALIRLRQALALDSGDRDAAFHLLAADGFATWACEAALEEDDPELALIGIMDILLE